MMKSDRIPEVLTAMSRKISEKKDFLTDLDNAIGDGDHGINMARGFAAVESRLPEFEGKDIGYILKTTGMTLVSVVAGSAGPLYGTAFMKAGMVMNGKNEMTADDFIECLNAAIDGVMMRGKAVQGEKTMLDAMIPARDAIVSAVKDGRNFPEAVKAGVEAAREGVEYTKTIIATKGRAAYVGERSLGHQDPGATSFTYLLETISEAL
ncbi:MAG: dihydroxyacetone kinase subunit L [Lachnospiraceae bacterium]|nr:dihydroxyacetone kinase subunit L [Candidatus Darwinimomas equi]